jgi:hypothetical protein
VEIWESVGPGAILVGQMRKGGDDQEREESEEASQPTLRRNILPPSSGLEHCCLPTSPRCVTTLNANIDVIAVGSTGTCLILLQPWIDPRCYDVDVAFFFSKIFRQPLDREVCHAEYNNV